MLLRQVVILLCSFCIVFGDSTVLKWTRLKPASLIHQKCPADPSRFPNFSLLEVNGTIHTWEYFKKIFKRNYKTEAEEKTRFAIFSANFLSMIEHNKKFKKGLVSYELGMTKFNDMTTEEVKLYKGLSPQLTLAKNRNTKIYAPTTLPHSLDWRTKGAVTPVKDQGACGSCWAFSATGSMESRQFIHKSGLFNLSEQQLVDCSLEYGNNGCGGGLMDNAFKYVINNTGIDLESSYPYTSGNTGQENPTCSFNRSAVGAQISGFVDVEHGNETALMHALQTGPVSVAINAGLPSFPHYKSGVYSDPDCVGGLENLDHGVLLVGYGVEQGMPYWLIKNSWGELWGERGYIKIHRKLCGVTSMASYPLF